MTKKINSRDKGARGEREVAKILTDQGYNARRGQQFSGSPDSPDVVVEGLPYNIHFEVKRVESGNPYKWLEQAERDAGVKFPLVVHKRNGKDWIAILSLKDFLTMIKGTK